MLEGSEDSLGAGTVKVWFATPDFSAIHSDLEVSQQLEILSPCERRRYSAFRFDTDRVPYLFAHLLLRRTLSRCVGIEPQDLCFGSGPFGKPFLEAPRSAKPVEFNLTHTKGLVACAISLNPVGLDAESLIRKPALEIAPSVLSESELANLRQTPDTERAQRLLEYWTLKEAFIKATGRGLSQPLDRFWFKLSRKGEPKINFASGESYRADHWRFVQLKGVSPSHEVAVAVSMPPKLDLSVEIRKFDWPSHRAQPGNEASADEVLH